MARQRRGGGFSRPELRGTLGTLLRTTLEQAGVVRDAIAGTARSRLDEARSHRRRQEALAELGEIVLDLVHRGEIDLAELPEARAVIRQLDELDGNHHEEHAAPLGGTPSRFDARGAKQEGTVSSKTWEPPFRAEKTTRVWRPAVDEPLPEAIAKPAPRRGGISFDDDDLANYMHPDDVPPKEPPDGDA